MSTDETRDDLRHQLAVLCARMGDDTDPVRSSPPARRIAQSIADRVRDGAALAQLAGDFDELEDHLLRAGYAAGLSPPRTYQRLPGVGDGRPVLEVLTCPADSCTRMEAPGTAATCPVFGQPLALVRLRS